MTRRLSAALEGFQRAVSLCPNNPKWWIHAGDVYYGAGEYERAKDLFLQGLKLDPWNRSGQRFLADTELQLGDLAASYRHGVLAVISDPTYESGWHFLRQFTEALGGRWHRTQSGEAVFWDQIARATEAGFLDEAIYIHLLDHKLVPGYREFRSRHADRLVEYITKVLAPLPPPDSRTT